MKKLIMVLGLFLLMAAALAWGSEPVALKVTAEVANVRAEPDINAAVIARVNVGTVLESLGKKGNWYKVELVRDGKTLSGYVHASIVEVLAEGGKKSAPQDEQIMRSPAVKSSGRTSQNRPTRTERDESYDSGIILHGGLSLASMTHSETDTGTTEENEYLKRKAGFLGGVSFDMGQKMGLEIGVFYMQKGVTYSGVLAEEGMNITGEAKMMIDEISVPVLLKIKFKPGSTPFLVAGGEVAYVLSSKVNWSWDNPETQQTESGSEDMKDFTASLDYGLVFGVGYQMHMDSMTLVVQGRYHLGLANIMKNDEASAGSPELVDDTSWTRTNAIVLMLGVMF